MVAQSPFSEYSGPAGVIDRMIGEEYAVIKAVAEKIPEFAEILVAIESIQNFDDLMVALTAARDAAAVSATSADTSADEALAYKAATDAFRAQAQSLSQAATVSEANALAHKNAASGSANAASNSAVAAGQSQTAAGVSATTAQKWATQITPEVATGQGYGAKKYALDAATSALAASGSATASEVARVAAVAAKNEAVEIAGFDPTLYALKTYAKSQAKRAAIVFGS